MDSTSGEQFAIVMAEFDKGTAIPTVDIAAMKQFAEVSARMLAEAPPKPNVAVGFGAYAKYGLDASSYSPQEFVAIWLRQNLLSALIQRGVLQEYMKDDESREKVYGAAATFPCNKEDLAEALILLQLSLSTPDVVAKAKEEFKQRGYDLDKPTIEGKFIAWMKDRG
jgi:hypothetical protein